MFLFNKGFMLMAVCVSKKFHGILVQENLMFLTKVSHLTFLVYAFLFLKSVTFMTVFVSKRFYVHEVFVSQNFHFYDVSKTFHNSRVNFKNWRDGVVFSKSCVSTEIESEWFQKVAFYYRGRVRFPWKQRKSTFGKCWVRAISKVAFFFFF